MDTCYVLYGVSDGDPNYDYYALNLFATGGVTSVLYELGDMWIHSQRSGGSTQYLWDRTPRQSSSMGCTTFPLTLSAMGLSFGVSATQCEQWIPTFYTAAGEFKNLWREGALQIMTTPQTRSVEFLYGAKVPTGGYPTYYFNWNSSAEIASLWT